MEAGAEDIDATRKCAAFLALPTNADLGLKLAWETSDLLWNWAGDTATDWNHYSKRTILSGILIPALTMRWFDGRERAEAFVAARIENVMAFEKWKAGKEFRRPAAQDDGCAEPDAVRGETPPVDQPRAFTRFTCAIFAPRTGFRLAVQVQAGVGFGRESSPLVDLVTQQIGHLDLEVGFGRTQGPAGDGADVLLELVAQTQQPSWVQWPVLWTRGGDLVDQQGPVPEVEELDAQHADVVEPVQDRRGDLRRAGFGSQPRHGRVRGSSSGRRPCGCSRPQRVDGDLAVAAAGAAMTDNSRVKAAFASRKLPDVRRWRPRLRWPSSAHVTQTCPLPSYPSRRVFNRAGAPRRSSAAVRSSTLSTGAKVDGGGADAVQGRSSRSTNDPGPRPGLSVRARLRRPLARERRPRRRGTFSNSKETACEMRPSTDRASGSS
jgi:hypothetical protein